MRCRGVSVRSRLGQTGSQYPHSTQRSTSSSIGRRSLIPAGARWDPRRSARRGSSPRPGRHNRLSSSITPYSSSPYCRRTYGAMARPVPCSALRLPPASRTRSTICSVKPVNRPIAASPSNRSVSMKWMLPSFAWPKMTAVAIGVLHEELLQAPQVSARAAVGTTMSSSRAVVPHGRAPATEA